MKIGNLLRIWLDLPYHALYFYENAFQTDNKCAKALFFIGVKN